MADTEHLDPKFWSALQQMIVDSGGRMSVVSAYRSIEEQTSLWNDALAKYGTADAARQWVAPPGHSNHNAGWAVDLGFSDGGLDWAHANASKYGLNFPMEWEPWHIEPSWARDGSADASDVVAARDGFANGSAYTDPPSGQMMVGDPNRNFNMGTQLQNLNALLMNPVEPAQPAPTRPELHV